MKIISKEQFPAYSLDEQVIEVFDPERLLIASFITIGNGNINHSRNESPSIHLFDGLRVEGIEENKYQLFRGNNSRFPVALLESGEDRGCDWVYYNRADKSKATYVALLVKGDENDIYHNLPVITVSHLEDNSILVEATDSLINQEKIFEAPKNKAFAFTGFTWVISGITIPGSKFTSMTVASNGFNQNGSSRPSSKFRLAFSDNPESWGIISDRLTDSEILDKNKVDLVLSPNELLDHNSEWLVLTIHVNNKKTLKTFSVPLNGILPQNLIDNL
jgi:hypothetical protein